MDYCRLRGGGFTNSRDLLRCDYVEVEYKLKVAWAPGRGRYIDAAWYPRQTQTRASASVADCTWPAQ